MDPARFGAARLETMLEWNAPHRHLPSALVLFVAIVFALSSCSEPPELEQNNDPARYALAEDVLWASPDGFDLTMDIYTPKSGRDAYPVIVMFHGGGWLINDKSIMDQSSA